MSPPTFRATDRYRIVVRISTQRNIRRRFDPEGIPDRIATTLPEVNVIVVLRDPVNRAWSQYQHEFARGYDQLSFEGALVAENERLEGEVPRLLRDPAYVSRSHVHHSYVGRGRYIEQIRRLHKTLGADRVLVC